MSKRKFRQKSPPILYGAGDKKILSTKSIAIVGLEMLQWMIWNLHFSSVVSRGAIEIDESLMSGSIEADGATIGIVLDSLAQKVLSKKYREAIQNSNLTLISSYYPDAKFNVGNIMKKQIYLY